MFGGGVKDIGVFCGVFSGEDLFLFVVCIYCVVVGFYKVGEIVYYLAG